MAGAGCGEETTVDLDVRSVDDIRIITVTGEIDATTAPRLEAALGSTERGGRIVLDLSGLELLDSTGLGVLIRAGRRLREAGGWLRLAAPPRLVLRVLDITSLSSELPTHPDVDAATAAP